jgi:O-succinylbenzoate synthase
LLEFRSYRRRFRQPLATAHGIWKEREGIIVRLRDTDGRVGYGEAAPVPSFTTETIGDMLICLRRQNGRLSPTSVAHIPQRQASVRWALACANAMLTGAFPPAKQRARPLTIAALLPAGKPALAALGKYAAVGYQSYKWKIATLPVANELKLLDGLLSALPPQTKLRLDANGGLTAREFVLWTRHLRNLGQAANAIEFLEQPLAAARMPKTQKPQRLFADDAGVPVALDESVCGLAALKRMARWPGPLVVKPTLLGDLDGFLHWRKQSRRDLVYSSVFETSVGLHAALWLAATDPEAGKRALGFGTLDALEADGLQLPVHAPGPTLTPTPLAATDFDELWNRLPISR